MSENLSTIYQIISEQFGFENSKICKECMGTFCHPIIKKFFNGYELVPYQSQAALNLEILLNLTCSLNF